MVKILTKGFFAQGSAFKHNGKKNLAMFYYKCKVPFKYIKKFLAYDLNACALVFSLFT
jgi:hypothetical protein